MKKLVRARTRLDSEFKQQLCGRQLKQLRNDPEQSRQLALHLRRDLIGRTDGTQREHFAIGLSQQATTWQLKRCITKHSGSHAA